MRVLVFGDSITQGFWDSEGGWVNRLRKHFDSETINGNIDAPVIMNLGISGDKTIDVINRLESEASSRLSDNGIALVFAIGINDTQIDDGIAVSDIDIYLEQLRILYNKAINFTKKIIFIGLSPVDDAHSNPLEWDEEGFDKICYNNERIQSFDLTLMNYCEQNNIKYINVYDKFIKEMTSVENARILLPDALHPSDKGHELIFNILKQNIIDYLNY